MYQRWLSNFTGFDACFSSSILLFHHFLHVSTINFCRCYAPININLEGCEGLGGGGGQTKAGDLTKEDHPLWGLVIIAKSWGWGLLKFLWLRMTSWIGSCERPGYQSVISCNRTGIGNWRWRPLFPQGFVVIFYTHVQDGDWRRAWHGICFYPLYSYSDKYISSFTLNCFRKLDSYSVRLHNTNVLAEFER